MICHVDGNPFASVKKQEDKKVGFDGGEEVYRPFPPNDLILCLKLRF